MGDLTIDDTGAGADAFDPTTDEREAELERLWRVFVRAHYDERSRLEAEGHVLTRTRSTVAGVEAVRDALLPDRDRAAAIERAAWAVKRSFRAVGADRNGLVQWTVDATAMKQLIIALGPEPEQT